MSRFIVAIGTPSSYAAFAIGAVGFSAKYASNADLRLSGLSNFSPELLANRWTAGLYVFPQVSG